MIMIVEDDQDLRADLAFLIESRGYSVMTAANGREALDRMKTIGIPDLILLDLKMPIMDGWELRSTLLKDPETSDVPVLVLSGAADLAEEKGSLQARDYLQKPIELERLYDMIARNCRSLGEPSAERFA